MSDERPQRRCDVCDEVDDHPRHVRDLGPVAGVQMHHMDCGAANDCETCQETEAENGELRGQELIDHLAAERAKQEA